MSPPFRRRPFGRPTTKSMLPHRAAVPLLVLLLLLPIAPAASGASAPGSSPLRPSHPPRLEDNGSVRQTVGNGTVWLNDSVTLPVADPGRPAAYNVTVTASGPDPGAVVQIQSQARIDWAGVSVLPFGPTNLPPLGDWTWWVTDPNGSNDTANWTIDADGLHLDRTALWTNLTFEIFGQSRPQVSIAVDPSVRSGTSTTGTGFVLAQAGSPNGFPNVSGYANLTASVHPTLVRLFAYANGWNVATGQPSYDFTQLDAAFALAEASGASVLLSLPVGTMGDGNSLPSGVPLNTTLVVNASVNSGYFPTPAAYAALVEGIANHTWADSEPVAYWSVGNEITLSSLTVVQAYARLINTAIDALGTHYPTARVGTDDMMNTTYLDDFANLTPSVGFLSLHFYTSKGVCQTANGSYCPPASGGAGTPDYDLFAHPAFQGNAGRLAPGPAVSAWHNATGRWLPVVVSETNLAYVGGIGSPTQNVGTDPRDPSLVGAAWLASLLIDCSTDNVSAITYYTFTSGANAPSTVTYADGGFGFGLTNVSSNGTVTRFASYWAMRLWGSYLPAGAPGLVVTDSDPAVAPSWAVASGTQIDLLVVNRVASNTTLHLAIAGNYTLNQTTVLDSQSYREVYDPVANTTTIPRSTVRTTLAPKTQNLTVHGYGVAVAVFDPATNGSNGSSGSGSGGSGSGSGGNGSGSGSTGGNGSGTGNGSGNQSSQGGSGGNGSGNQSTPTNQSTNRSAPPASNQSGPSSGNGSNGSSSRPPPAANVSVPGTPPGTQPVHSALTPAGRGGWNLVAGLTALALLGGVAIAAYAAVPSRRASQAARLR